MDKERRRYKRLRTRGTADIRFADGRRYAYAELGDLSESGCYIETLHPLAVDTKVELTLAFREPEISIRVSATVCTSDQGVGMGVAFTGGQVDELKETLERMETSPE